MKTNKIAIAAFMALATFTACQNNQNTEQGETTKTAFLGAAPSDSADTCASDIPVDSANKMIGSYITSINGNPQNENLYSLIADANCLRTYLNNNPQVTNVKFMFAHTLDYINSGHSGQPAGYKSGALTLVLAGYDKDGNYVIINNEVMDNMRPCPTECPSGTASSVTIPE